MKKLLPFALIALGAFAASGETPQTTSSNGTKVVKEDSPLVRAARESARKRKTATNVITNQTLKQRGSKAHITTTKSQPPVPVIPQTGVEQKPKVIVVPSSEPAQASPKQTLANAVDDAEDPYSDMDPAQAERLADQAAKVAAEKQAEPEKKPPQR
ncbi:MAG: hypothetical protein WA208_10165 [Thermoanaerobaculia bacterium]